MVTFLLNSHQWPPYPVVPSLSRTLWIWRFTKVCFVDQVFVCSLDFLCVISASVEEWRPWTPSPTLMTLFLKDVIIPCAFPKALLPCPSWWLSSGGVRKTALWGPISQAGNSLAYFNQEATSAASSRVDSSAVTWNCFLLGSLLTWSKKLKLCPGKRKKK